MQSKLYALRKEAGLTQEDLANMLGISRSRYGQKELGKAEFTQDEMFELGKIFDRNINDIFLPRTYQIGTK